MPSPLRWVGFGLLALAIGAGGFAVSRWSTRAGFIDRATRVQAVVVEQREFRHYQGARLELIPVFGFSLGGVDHRLEGNPDAGYALNDTATIFVDPSDPQVFLVDDFSSRWLDVLISSGVSLVLLILGLVVVLVRW